MSLLKTMQKEFASKMDEYPEAKEMADRLSVYTKMRVTAKNYIDWMEGGGESGSGEKFDNAVVKYLGDEVYEELLQLARVPYLLGYALNVLPKVFKRKVGGVDMKPFLSRIPNYRRPAADTGTGAGDTAVEDMESASVASRTSKNIESEINSLRMEVKKYQGMPRSEANNRKIHTANKKMMELKGKLAKTRGKVRKKAAKAVESATVAKDLKTAQAYLKPLGIILKHDKEYDEYTVNFKGGKEATKYHTSDLDDALGTGKIMAKENGEKASVRTSLFAALNKDAK